MKDKINIFWSKIWHQDVRSDKKKKVSLNIYSNLIYLYSISVCVLIALIYLYFSQPSYVCSIHIPLKQLFFRTALSDQKNDSLKISALNKIRIKEQGYLLSPGILQQACLKSDFGITYFKENLFFDMELTADSSPVKISLIKNDWFSTRQISINLYKNKYLEISTDGKKSISEYTKINHGNGFDFVVNKGNPNVISDQPIRVKIDNLNDLVKNVKASITITYPTADSNNVELSINSFDKKKAAKLLNNIRSVYLSSNPDSNLYNSVKFIDQKLDSLKLELKKYPLLIAVEKKKTKRHLTSVPQIKSVDKASLKKQSDIYNVISTYLKIPDNQFSFVPNTFGLKDSELELIVNKINDFQIEKQKLLRDAKPSSVSLLEKNKQIKILKDVIRKRIDSLNNDIVNELSGNSIQKLNAGNPKSERAINSLNAIVGEQQAKVALYFYFIRKREAFLTNVAELNRSALLNKSVTAIPVGKPVLSIILSAILMGLIIPVFFRLQKKSTPYKLTSNELLNSTIVPFLGSMGHYARNKKSISPFEYDSAVGIQLLNIIKNIEFNKNNRIIILTSLKPGDGKSFIARNLAIALSTLGKSVLYIHTGFLKLPDDLVNVTPAKDLSLYLENNTISISNIAYESNFHNLSIIQSGHLDPGKLIGSLRMDALIQQAKSIFDHVIIDSWSSSLTDLNQLVVKNINMLICVVDLPSASKDVIEDLNKSYQSLKRKNMFLITNKKNDYSL